MIHALVIVGAFANLAGSSVYFLDTLRGKSKPNRMTFLMWAIAPLIATIAALSAGVTWAVVPVFVSGLCPMLILFASFANKKAYWKLERFDYVCGVFSVLALVLWAITKDPLVAIVFAILSDGFAALPTLIKAWRFPDTETLWGYLGAAFSGATGVLAAASWNFVSLAFPIYLSVTCIAIATGIIVGRLRVR